MTTNEEISKALRKVKFKRLIKRRSWQSAFQGFAHNLGRSIEAQGLSEEDFMADLEKTKREVFTERYGR